MKNVKGGQLIKKQNNTNLFDILNNSILYYFKKFSVKVSSADFFFPKKTLTNFRQLMKNLQIFHYQRHRVVIPESSASRSKGRHSIAYFVHPDNLTPIVPIEAAGASSSSTEEIDGAKVKKERKKSFKAAKMRY